MLPAELELMGPVGRALRDYGAYVVDAHTNEEYQVGIFVERGVADELTEDVSQWVPALSVVE
jgi:hypothetical protein